ncbi:MAG: ScyD/ScyE family protein [bacterium]|nr:ScyD/ScyE family protein [bacterium]MDE0352070.1 ScyD/ScyE family protein [bacterium]
MSGTVRILTKIGLPAAACLVILACGGEPTSDDATTGATRAPTTTTTAPTTSATTTSVPTPTTGGSLETSTTQTAPEVLTVEVVLTDLENPRGVGVDAEGALLIAEAGYGEDADAPILRTGRLTRFLDLNGDGDFLDPGEAERWLDNLFSFNSVNKYETGRDEVSGATDVLVHEDGRVFLSLDGGIDQSGGTFILFELDEDGTLLREINQNSNMTGIGFAPDQRSVYASQSTHNSLIEIRLEDGDVRHIVTFEDLYSGQQAVPAGLAVDPTTGDVLVALFSGVAKAEGEACRFVPEAMCDGRYLPLIPTDAKVVRVDPATGSVTDEVTGLTAAVDVAADSEGNVFTVEMAADHAQLFHLGVDLFLADLPALHGGYIRFSGRVTMYPADGGDPRVLAEGLDQPTNITVGPDGALYVSTGQGTPGRPIPGPQGRTEIVGEVLRITGYK